MRKFKRKIKKKREAALKKVQETAMQGIDYGTRMQGTNEIRYELGRLDAYVDVLSMMSYTKKLDKLHDLLSLDVYWLNINLKDPSVGFAEGTVEHAYGVLEVKDELVEWLRAEHGFEAKAKGVLDF